MSLMQDLMDSGHEKLGRNLWKKGDFVGYLREGKLVDARSVSTEDAKTFDVEVARIPRLAPKPVEAKTGLDNFTAKTATLNELKGEAYQEARAIVEKIDESLIEAELAGEVVDKLVYKFTSAGREVVGLTWPGVRFIAKHVGQIVMESLDVVDNPETWIVKVRATDKKSGTTMFGLAQQSKTLERRDGSKQPDNYSLEKCSSRAMRNAMRALIPEQESIVLLNKWLKESLRR